MPLLQMGFIPMPGFGWLNWLLVVPSKKSTERARKQLKQDKYLLMKGALVNDFADGKIKVGDQINIDREVYTFRGAKPKRPFPEAMLFSRPVYDENFGQTTEFVNFTGWGALNYKGIVPPQQVSSTTSLKQEVKAGV